MMLQTMYYSRVILCILLIYVVPVCVSFPSGVSKDFVYVVVDKKGGRRGRIRKSRTSVLLETVWIKPSPTEKRVLKVLKGKRKYISCVKNYTGNRFAPSWSERFKERIKKEGKERRDKCVVRGQNPQKVHQKRHEL